MSAFLSICPFVCLSVCLSVFLSVCMFVCLYVCMYVVAAVAACFHFHMFPFSHVFISTCFHFHMFISACFHLQIFSVPHVFISACFRVILSLHFVFFVICLSTLLFRFRSLCLTWVLRCVAPHVLRASRRQNMTNDTDDRERQRQ